MGKNLFWLFALWSFATSCSHSRTDQVSSSIDKGITFLKKIQNADGAICDTSNRLFDIWESALAADVLFDHVGDSNDLVFRKLLNFLRTNQNPNGLICHNQKCRNSYCLETTTVYFNLLLKLGDTQNVARRFYLIDSMQKPDGSFDIGNPDVKERRDFPSVTAFVLGTRENLGTSYSLNQEGIVWLANAQNPEGHWGTAWEYYDCPGYALWPVMRLLNMYHQPPDQSNKVFLKATKYIRESQLPDGSWFYRGMTPEKSPSPELQTALMLSALQYADTKEDEIVFRKGIDFLLAHQQSDGSWNGGFFPIPNERYEKKEYVFATAKTLGVLNEFLKKEESIR